MSATANLPEGVTIVESGKPGPAVAIMGGTHGDERAGIELVRRLPQTLKIARGRVYGIVGNLRAIQKRVRFVEQNLNRCFVPGQPGTSYEARRAAELMPVLDRCDATLDLHEHSHPELGSFIITESNGFSAAEAIGAPIISYGWSAVEPGGTDAYLPTIGKVGLCYESGCMKERAGNLKRAAGAVDRFLASFGLTDRQPEPLATGPRWIKATRVAKRTTKRFALARKFKTFEPLRFGELIATADGVEDRAGKDEIIIFPKQDPPMGTEGYLIGREGKPEGL